MKLYEAMVWIISNDMVHAKRHWHTKANNIEAAERNLKWRARQEAQHLVKSGKINGLYWKTFRVSITNMKEVK